MSKRGADARRRIIGRTKAAGERLAKGLPDGATVKLKAMFNHLATAPRADEMDFSVARSPEDQAVGRTFSEEALADLTMAIATFIHARVQYHWEQKPGGTGVTIGPALIKAEVRVTVDGVHMVPDDDERPWYVVDGQGRAIAQRRDGDVTRLEVRE